VVSAAPSPLSICTSFDFYSYYTYFEDGDEMIRVEEESESTNKAPCNP